MKELPIPARTEITARPRLDALFARAVKSPLVTVFAGPGYGKRQALATFLQQAELRAAWMRATRLDNIPTRFWGSLCTAIESLSPPLARQFTTLGYPESAGQMDIVARQLAREAQQAGLLLVIEDYDQIRSSEIHHFIENLAELRLDNFCLVLIGQQQAELNLLNLMERGLLFQITAGELKYTMAETAQLLEQQNISYNAQSLGDFYQRTEGWPLAVEHLARNAHSHLDNSEHQYFSGYLQLFSSNFYADYPATLRLFFIKLACLPFFNTDMISQIGGHNMMEAISIIQAHQFVNYNPVTSMYSFHPMYRNFLHSRQPAVPPQELARVYALAGDWFARNGWWFEAVTCYEKCGRYDDMYQAILSLPIARKEKSLADFVLNYLDRLPENFVRANPMARCSRAAMLINNMEIDEAEKIFLDLRQDFESRPPTPENQAFLGELYIMLSDVAFIRNSDEMGWYYRQAAKRLPQGSTLRDNKLMLIENNGVLFLTQPVPGELARLEAMFMQDMPVGSAVMHGCGQGLEHLFAAEAAYYTGNAARARDEAFRAIYRAGEMGQHDIVCNAHNILMQQSVAAGNYREALHHLNALTAVIEDNNAVSLFVMRDCLRGWLFIQLGDEAGVPAWVSSHSSAALRQAPVGLGRAQLVQGLYLLQQKRSHELLALLAQLEPYYKKRGLWLALLQARIMRALGHLRNEAPALAMDALYEAYDMSWQNGIIMPFVQHGSAMRTLIEAARRQAEYRFDAAWLDSVQQKASTYAKRLAAVVAEHHHANPKSTRTLNLTQRETAVLKSMAQGLTRDEIGAQMHISVNTVKSVIKSIYNKLDAVNRAEAVHIAIMNGLLE